MKTIKLMIGLLDAVLAFSGRSAAFENLDFEQGTTSIGSIGVRPDGSSVGPISVWLPGWQLYNGEGIRSVIDLNLNLGNVDGNSLYDANYRWELPVDGKLGFLAILSNPALATSLVQIGTIPDDAKTLHYGAQGGPWEVRVNGIELELHGSNPDDNRLVFQDVAVDVSPWAGQQVELKFSQAQGYEYCAIDSIRFSVDPIPEPRSELLWMAGSGTLWMLFRKRGRGRMPSLIN